MEKSLSAQVNKLIGNGETRRALELTRDYLAQQKNIDKAYRHSVVMLLGKYNKYEKEQRLGLGPDPKQLNQIEYNLLNIVEDIKAGRTAATAAAARRQNAAAQTSGKSKGSPVLWVFATIGVIFILLMVIGLSMEEDEVIPTEFTTTLPTDTELKQEKTTAEVPTTESTTAESTIAEEPTVEEPTDFTAVSDQIITGLLANTTWYESSIGYIVFDASGRNATYANGVGSVQITGLDSDGFVHAVYTAPNLTQGYLAFLPQMNNYTLTVYLQSLYDAEFMDEPMIWAKQ